MMQGIKFSAFLAAIAALLGSNVGQSATSFKSRLLTIVCLCSTYMVCIIVPNACNV